MWNVRVCGFLRLCNTPEEMVFAFTTHLRLLTQVCRRVMAFLEDLRNNGASQLTLWRGV